jgi:hypothetical protein
MRLLVLTLAVSACADTDDGPHRADELPVYQLPGFQPLADSTLDGAQEILGLEFIADEWGRGAVGMVWVERCMGSHCGATKHDDCRPVVWTIDNDYALAHELGHALGLLHSEDPTNLMFPTAPTDNLTDDQIDQIRWKAWHLQHECS